MTARVSRSRKATEACPTCGRSALTQQETLEAHLRHALRGDSKKLLDDTVALYKRKRHAPYNAIGFVEAVLALAYVALTDLPDGAL